MLRSLHIYNVAVPDEFPMLTVSESTIGSGEAQFIFMIDSSVFTVTNDNLVLSGGDGMCEIDGPTSQPLDLTCHGLSDGTPYNLAVDLSVDDNCLTVLISFNTPSLISPPTDSSTGMLPV